jgi:hypothetical protein
MTTRKPTQWEFENCDHFELTAEHPVYDPHCEYYAAQESDMTDANGQLRTIQDAPHPRLRQICSVAHEVSVIKARYIDTDAKLQHINEALDDKTLLAGLHRNVQISEMNMSSLNVTVRKGGVDVPTLARNLGISLEAASRTRAVTTQRGVKSMIYPSLSQRRSTNNRHTRYRRLNMALFTDTIFSKTKSRQQNTAAHIFFTQSGWTRAYPLKLEADAHEALALLAQRDGVPEVLVMDGSKAQAQGEFLKKCREFDIRVKRLEAYN